MLEVEAFKVFPVYQGAGKRGGQIGLWVLASWEAVARIF
jgi:hypothetical protein